MLHHDPRLEVSENPIDATPGKVAFEVVIMVPAHPLDEPHAQALQAPGQGRDPIDNDDPAGNPEGFPQNLCSSLARKLVK